MYIHYWKNQQRYVVFLQNNVIMYILPKKSKKMKKVCKSFFETYRELSGRIYIITLF